VGTRAGLNLGRIVEAARSIDPDTLTMQALADQLGVDRKALNHHVSDRDTLLGLVALDSFAATFSGFDLTAHSDWRDACRAYAYGITESVVAAGALAGHLRLDDALATRVLETTEVVLAKLVQAGFDDATAVRLLALLSNICLSFARDVTFLSRSGQRPRPLLLRESLTAHEPAVFENLARIAADPVDTYSREQLELSIRVFLLGAEGLLERG
jgi:AcrR family transcriptional regulator